MIFSDFFKKIIRPVLTETIFSGIIYSIEKILKMEYAGGRFDL